MGRSAPAEHRGGGGQDLSSWKRWHEKPSETDLNESPVLALRAFIQLLLLPVTDVEDPAEEEEGLAFNITTT